MNATGINMLIGASNAMRRVLQQIEQVAPTPAPVLIHGEKGVGKTLVAELIHQESPRRNRSFVKVHCMDTPVDQFEHELFGFEGEAYSGNWNVGTGWLAKARGGTIFFDEITALAPATQIKLLRLLEDRVFEPPGSDTPVSADIRLLAATRRSQEQFAHSQTFRQDLYYRLTVFPIQVPPLREHKTDIPALAEYFIDRYARKHGVTVKGILAPGKSHLLRHRWPGNVRELEECIEMSILASTDGWLRIDCRCCPANFWVDSSHQGAQDISVSSA